MEQNDALTENLKAQKKELRQPIVDENGIEDELVFNFGRNDIADIINANEFGFKLSALLRNVLLRTINPEQRNKFADLINDKENMSIVEEIVISFTPFLRQNKTTLGVPRVG